MEDSQLDRLEDLLAAQDAPIVNRLRPGASAATLERVETWLGARLPEELRRWWCWHDGAQYEPHARIANGSIGPFFTFFDAERAVLQSDKNRDLALEVAPDDPDSLWKSTWIAIGSLGKVACEGGVDAESTVPVLDVDYHHTSEPGRIAARSIGEMVRWWIEALESGAWKYEADREIWIRQTDLVPLEQELSGLV